MLALLTLGFLTGMRHALEADHLAAVAALSTRTRGAFATIMRGAAWGAGHTVSLLVLGGVCLAAGASISDAQAFWFERVVGIMLIGLGLHVLLRLRRKGIRFHVHRHGDGRAHLHAHPATEANDRERHHRHPAIGHLKAMIVGMVHGAAGTAAILLLTATSVGSFWWGLAHIGSFGLGSILGMALLSAVIAVPFELTSQRMSRAFGVLEAFVAVVSVAIGAARL
jgi:cytochrome c biogenesis protein CcdA